MIEVVIIDRDNPEKDPVVHTGECAVSSVGDNNEASVSVYGHTNPVDVAKNIGICMSSLLQTMTQKDNNPTLMLKMCKAFLVENLYQIPDEIVPGKQDA